MGRIPSRGSDQFMVRFPDGMRDRIREEADKNGRSMNAEIIARLEDSLDPRGRANVFGVATSLPAEDRREAAMLAEAIEQYMRRKWRQK